MRLEVWPLIVRSGGDFPSNFTFLQLDRLAQYSQAIGFMAPHPQPSLKYR